MRIKNKIDTTIKEWGNESMAYINSYGHDEVNDPDGNVTKIAKVRGPVNMKKKSFVPPEHIDDYNVNFGTQM